MSVLVEHIKASSVANYEECMAQQGTIAMIGCPSVINRVGGPLHCLFGDESPDGLSEKKARLHRAVLDPAVTPRVEGGDVLNKSLCEGISCWVQCKLKGGKLLRRGRQFTESIALKYLLVTVVEAIAVRQSPAPHILRKDLRKRPRDKRRGSACSSSLSVH